MNILPEDIRTLITKYSLPDNPIISEKRLYEEILDMNPSFDPRRIIEQMIIRGKILDSLTAHKFYPVYDALKDTNFYISTSITEGITPIRSHSNDINVDLMSNILSSLDVEVKYMDTELITMANEGDSDNASSLMMYLIELLTWKNYMPIYPRVITQTGKNRYEYRNQLLRTGKTSGYNISLFLLHHMNHR